MTVIKRTNVGFIFIWIKEKGENIAVPFTNRFSLLLIFLVQLENIYEVYWTSRLKFEILSKCIVNINVLYYVRKSKKKVQNSTFLLN